MKSFTYTIRDEVGIHARPAGLLVNAARALGSKITVEKDGKAADACKLFSLLSLGVKCGDTVTVSVDGGNEAADLASIKEFFEKNL